MKIIKLLNLTYNSEKGAYSMNKMKIFLIFLVLFFSCSINKSTSGSLTSDYIPCDHGEVLEPNAREIEFINSLNDSILQLLGPNRFKILELFDSTFLSIEIEQLKDNRRFYLKGKIPIQDFDNNDFSKLDSIYVLKEQFGFKEGGGHGILSSENRPVDDNEKGELIKSILTFKDLQYRNDTLMEMLYIDRDQERIFRFKNFRTLEYYENGLPDYIKTTYLFRKKINNNWCVFDRYYLCKEEQYGKDPEPYRVISRKYKRISLYRNKPPDTSYLPINIYEAHEEIKKIFAKESIKITDSLDMVSFHHGLGTWIRNNWGLWGGYSNLSRYFTKNNIHHPDDMSAILLKSFKKRELLKKSDNYDSLSFYSDSIPTYFPYYIEYWEKMKK